jgi:predicted DNA-binding transcriptional regulator AlpA
MEKAFISASEVGEMTGLSESALAAMRTRGTGPRFYKPRPRMVLYKRAEVLAWIEASAQSRTGSSVVA